MPNQKPTKILEKISDHSTSTNPFIVETDGGRCVLKAMGNPGGDHTLICEWIGTRIAQAMKIPTLNFSLIQVENAESLTLKFPNGNYAKNGPGFITQFEPKQSWDGDIKILERSKNIDDLNKLIVLDTWILNCDRYSPKDKPPRRNNDNVFFSNEDGGKKFVIKAIDHTHCLTCGHEITANIQNIDNWQSEQIFGFFPEFRKYIDPKKIELILGEISAIEDDLLKDIVMSTPVEWGFKSELKAVLELLKLRKNFLCTNMKRMILMELGRLY